MSMTKVIHEVLSICASLEHCYVYTPDPHDETAILVGHVETMGDIWAMDWDVVSPYSIAEHEEDMETEEWVPSVYFKPAEMTDDLFFSFRR